MYQSGPLQIEEKEEVSIRLLQIKEKEDDSFKIWQMI
jgi:hypothetical protein